jgi:hypothetical protein
MPIFFLITVAKVFNGRQTALRRLGRLLVDASLSGVAAQSPVGA